MYNMIHVVYLMIPCAVSGIRLWKNLWKTAPCVDLLALYHMYLTSDSMLAKSAVTDLI